MAPGRPSNRSVPALGGCRESPPGRLQLSGAWPSNQYRIEIGLMSAALQNPPGKRWTRAECERLEAAGVFDQQRVELIEGELIVKMSKNRPHVNTAALLTAWLIQIFGGLRVNAEAPID